MWGPLSDHHCPWAGALCGPCARHCWGQRDRKRQYMPLSNGRNIKSRTQGKEKSGMEMAGCASQQGKIMVDRCAGGRLHEGGDRWAGPHRKEVCCLGGRPRLGQGHNRRPTGDQHSSPLALQWGTCPVLRTLLRLPSPLSARREPGTRDTSALVISRYEFPTNDAQSLCWGVVADEQRGLARAQSHVKGCLDFILKAIRTHSKALSSGVK